MELTLTVGSIRLRLTIGQSSNDDAASARESSTDAFVERADRFRHVDDQLDSRLAPPIGFRAASADH
jgi:hypothetical protein